jgi:predicted ATPase with chaperone activity
MAPCPGSWSEWSDKGGGYCAEPSIAFPVRSEQITRSAPRRSESRCGHYVHNLLLLGPSGVGTSRRRATILPAMDLAEALETTPIHSVAGLTGGRTAVVTTRPFRALHHTISNVGLIGGAQRPLPGEVSLAYHGILCLGERPEGKRHVPEVQRQPLENGITRTPSPVRSRSCGPERTGHD